MVDFRQLVKSKIGELGVKDAAKFFGVSMGTVSNWKTGKSDPPIRAVEMVYDEPAFVNGEREEITMWNGREVIMLLPVYRTFNPDTHYTLFANYAKYGPEKIGMLHKKRTLIYEARNILVHKAKQIEPKPKYVIFCDDDMILPCGNPGVFNDIYEAKVPVANASLNAISRLMSHPPDKRIVGALYFGRHSKGPAQCSLGFADKSANARLRKGQYKGLLADEWVGTGLLRINMDVFEQMDKEIAKGRWPECAPVGLDGWAGYFCPQRVRMGEDVSFGRRAKEIGIQSYVDTSLICLHNGDRNYGPSNTSD